LLLYASLATAFETWAEGAAALAIRAGSAQPAANCAAWPIRQIAGINAKCCARGLYPNTPLIPFNDIQKIFKMRCFGQVLPSHR